MMSAPDDIRSVVHGVAGSFLLHQDRTALSDFDSDLSSVSKDIFWLKKFLQEKHEASRMYVYGQKRNIILYLDGEFTMGVMVSKEANIHLLHRVVNKILTAVKTAHAEKPLNREEPYREAKEFFNSL